MTTALKPERYHESAREVAIDLSDNTNLWGSAPSVAAVVARASAPELSRYPSAYSDDLKVAIAEVNGVEPSMVVVGCGSDDVIDSALRAISTPGDVLVQVAPTFSMVRTFATCSHLTVQDVSPASPDVISAICAANPSIVYVCSPNNPTGGVIPAEVIEAIAAEVPATVIVDEAYIDFGGASAIGFLARHDNLLITRTFSKAYGLAGLRLGYAIAQSDVVERIEAARGPYKVTSIAERAGIEALRTGRGWVDEKVSMTIRNRRRFAEALVEIGLQPMDSKGNFVLIPVEDSSAFSHQLSIRGIGVRSFRGLDGIGDAIRVTIGPWEMMSPCIAALAEIVS